MAKFLGSLRLEAPGRDAEWVAHAVLFVLATVMWWPTLFGGKSLIFGDSVVHGLPLLHFLKDYLHGGESPLWVKEIYGGHPLFAEGQGAFADPLNILIAWIFPPVLGNNVFHFVCMLLAGAGVIRLCRILGCSAAAAGFAALSVVFSGYWLYLQHNLTVSGALAWVPWALVAFECWLKKPSVPRAIGMAAAGTMLILSGYPQVIHGVAILALCTLTTMPFSAAGRLQWSRYRWIYLWTGALGVLLCIGLSALQLFPLMELLGMSHRQGGTGVIFQKDAGFYMRGMLFALDERTQVPGTSSMLVCMLASVTVAIRSTWRVKGYLIGAVLLVMLGMGNVTWLFRVVYDAHLIPGMHYFRIMQIYLAIGTVGLAVLAAFAIDALTSWLLEHRDLRTWTRPTFGGVALFVAVWFVIAFRAGSGYQVWFPVLLVVAALLAMAALSLTGRAQMIPAAMLALFVLYCACFPVRHLKFYDVALLTPPTVLDNLPRNDPDNGKFFTVSVAGVYGLVDSRWPNLGRMAQRALASDLGLSNLLRGDSSLDGALALQLYNRDILSQPMKDEVLGISQTTPGARLIDLLNVRFITSDVELDTPGFRVAGHDPLGFWVMENTLARPFVQIYTRAMAARSIDDSLARLRTMHAPTLIVQADPGGVPVPQDEPSSGGDAADAQVKMIRSASSHYIMDVQAPFACWIFLADANYPGWYATVDGVSTKVWTAQVLGKAVHLSAGRHRVVVAFRSSSFHAGLVITLLSLLVALSMLLVCGHAQWRHQAPPRG